jgi:agmatinase
MSSMFFPANPPFMGASPALPAGAAFFGAPHGTPYPDMDNRAHAGSAQAVRDSFGHDRTWVEHWNFDFGGKLLGDKGFRFADLGDLKTSPMDGPGNRAMITAAAQEILNGGAVPIMMGGDDSTPIPFLAAFAGRGPVTILQIDAHIDWRDGRRGERMGFSSTMRRASEMAHVERIVQTGMRGFGSARQAEVETARAWGAHFIPARALHRDGIDAVLDLIPPGTRVVVTIDCDALDPGIMPAVMAPAPGGLNYMQVTGLIEGVIAKASLAGLDIIEFVPARDAHAIAATTCASIISFTVGSLAKRG